MGTSLNLETAVIKTKGDELGQGNEKAGRARRNSIARIFHDFGGSMTHVPLPGHKEFWKLFCSGDRAKGRILRCLLLLLPLEG